MSVSTRVSRKRTNGKVRLMIETGGYRHPGGTYEGEVDEDKIKEMLDDIGDVYCGRFRNNQPYENATLTMTFDDPTFEIDDDSSCDPYAISRAKPRKRAGQSEEERLKEEEEEAKKREPPKVVSVRHLFDGKMIEFDPETKTDNLAVLKAEHQHIDSSDSSEEETTDDDATQATAMSLSSYTGSATSATMTTMSEAKSRR